MLKRRAHVGTSALVISVLLLLGVLCSPLTALAAPSPSADALVVVARDVTASAHCTQTFAERPHGVATFTVTRNQLCPEGALIQTMLVKRSEAIRLHEAYAIPAAADASAASLAAAETRIRALVVAQQTRAQPRSVRPLSWCNAVEKYASTTWTFSAASDGGSAEVDWNTNSDCSLSFNYSGVVWSTGPNVICWQNSQYSTATLDSTCTSLPDHAWHTHSLTSGATYAPGYNFNVTLVNNAGSCSNSGNQRIYPTISNLT